MAQQAVPVLDLPMSQLKQDKEIKRWPQLSEGRVHNHSVRGRTQRAEDTRLPGDRRGVEPQGLECRRWRVKALAFTAPLPLGGP